MQRIHFQSFSDHRLYWPFVAPHAATKFRLMHKDHFQALNPCLSSQSFWVLFVLLTWILGFQNWSIYAHYALEVDHWLLLASWVSALANGVYLFVYHFMSPFINIFKWAVIQLLEVLLKVDVIMNLPCCLLIIIYWVFLIYFVVVY